VRALAVVTPAGRRDTRAISVLAALLNEDTHFPHLIRALGSLGPAAAAAVPAILKGLEYRPARGGIPAHNRPIQLAGALGEIGPRARAAIPTLLDLVKQRPHFRLAVAATMGQIGAGARATVPFLRHMLLSPARTPTPVAGWLSRCGGSRGARTLPCPYSSPLSGPRGWTPWPRTR
jgi:hypothetical protein